MVVLCRLNLEKVYRNCVFDVVANCPQFVFRTFEPLHAHEHEHIRLTITLLLLLELAHGLAQLHDFPSQRNVLFC